MTRAVINKAILIDDENFDHTIYKRLFRRSGLVREAISFAYAEEALEFLKAADLREIGAIFLDINMPRMNGFEFLAAAARELDAAFANQVVIMLTTSLDPEDSRRAREFEAVKMYLSKPLTIDDVARAAQLAEEHRNR